MTRYAFPDVPIATGVPDVARSAIGAAQVSGILSTIQRYDVFGLTDIYFGPKWQILDKSGNPIITPDSVLAIEYRGEQKVATHPVENGSFSSYNKVAIPFDLRIRVTCNGQGKHSRSDFLAKIQSMLNSTDLYSVSTPDVVYKSVNLEHFDYRRESRGGVSLITAEMWFTEIRQRVSDSGQNVAQPSAAKTISIGSLSVTLPTQQQIASYIKSAIQ